MKNTKPTITNVRELLKRVQDPELGIDIVSLGFVKKIEILKNKIKISMVLTFFGCPFISVMVSDATKIIENKYAGYIVEVKILKQKWTPPKAFKLK